MNEFWQQLKGILSRFTPMQRLIGGVLVGSLVLFLAWTYVRPVPMTTLYTNLPLEDLARVQQKLEEDNVPYEIEGTTVHVASANFNETRLNLAIADQSLAGGMGYELFDVTDFDMSPNKQRIQEQRALQTELERTIRTLAPVQKARVHIVIPDFSPFIRETPPVTASIVVTPRGGSALAAREVEGIAAFVAGSVGGLHQENVTVVDNQGRVRTQRPESPDSSVSGDQLAYQREVEATLESKAESLLDSVLGHGQSVVRVSAEIDFRRIREMQHNVDPEERVQIYESLSDSTSEESVEPIGVPGAASNLSPVVPAAASGTGGNSAEQMIESKWEPGKVVHEFEQKRNAIQRLTVAVMLRPQDPDAQSEEDALGMTRADAQDLVKNAVGFKGGRDSITVTVGSPTVEPVPEDLPTPWYASEKFYYAAGFFLLCATGLFIVVWFLRQMKAQAEAQQSAATALAGEDMRNLETMAEALRVWVDDE